MPEDPVVLVEGHSDFRHLTVAWNKLNPEVEIPWKIVPCGGESSKSGRGGAEMLRTMLRAISLNPNGPVLGLFDRDREGVEQFFSLKKSDGFDEKTDETHLMHARSIKPVHALLLPVPRGRENFVSERPTSCFLAIEHYYSDTILKRFGLADSPVVPDSLVFPIKGNSNSKGKLVNALESLGKSEFANFQQLFNRLSLLLGIPGHLDADLLTESPDPDGRRVLEVPASKDLLGASNRHAAEVYPRVEAFSLDEVTRWLTKNPFCVAVLCSATGQYVGYFDVLPITEAAATALCDRGIAERDIGPDMILSPKDMHQARSLYFSSVVVKGRGTELGKKRTACLLSGLVAYMRRYYPKRPIRDLAIPITEDGLRLVHGINSVCIRTANARRDGHDLYELQWTQALENQILNRLSRRLPPEEVEVALRETATPAT